jgi:hypothetical protein
MLGDTDGDKKKETGKLQPALVPCRVSSLKATPRGGGEYLRRGYAVHLFLFVVLKKKTVPPQSLSRQISCSTYQKEKPNINSVPFPLSRKAVQLSFRTDKVIP